MNTYKMFKVTVEILMYGCDKVYNTLTFPIKAKDAEEADAIVHNRMVFSHEPRFRIKEVKEMEE